MPHDELQRDEQEYDEQEEGENPRQQARRLRKEAGDRSARASHTLMALPEAEVPRLGLDQEMRAAVDRARAVTPRVARRREERRLAKILRNADLADLEQRLERLQTQGHADVRAFQRAETWRARLIEEGPPAAEAFVAEHPAVKPEQLAELITAARREQKRGKPRGAKKALFRQVMTALRARR